MLVCVYNLHLSLIEVKDFLHRCPPLTFGARVKRLLHGFHDSPPFLRLGIACDLGHICFVIHSVVFVIAEQQIILQKDRVVADVASPNGGENLRPDLRMVSFIGLDLLGSYLYYGTVSLHSSAPLATRNEKRQFLLGSTALLFAACKF